MVRFCLVAAVAMAPVMARAASLHGDEKGAGLEISLSCARDIKVTADAGLAGEVVMDATADHAEEIAQIDFVADSAVKLKMHGRRCWRTDTDDFQPTLAITLRVPAGYPLGVDAAGNTDYHVAVGGPLAFDLSGSGQLDATKVTNLSMDLSGSGAARVDEVTGMITLDLAGSARLSIKQAQSAMMAAKVSGSGHVRVENGSIAQLTMDGSGSGDVVLGGRVGNAVVDLSGSGGVTIGKLTGKLTDDSSGSGKVVVVSH